MVDLKKDTPSPHSASEYPLYFGFEIFICVCVHTSHLIQVSSMLIIVIDLAATSSISPAISLETGQAQAGSL